MRTTWDAASPMVPRPRGAGGKTGSWQAHHEAGGVDVQVHIEDVHRDDDGTRLLVDPPVVLHTACGEQSRALAPITSLCSNPANPLPLAQLQRGRGGGPHSADSP